MRRWALGLCALVLGCGHPGSVEWTVRDPSGKIVVAPANSARFDAARRELEGLVGHPIGLQIDASLLSNNLASFTEEYARMVETVVASLRYVERTSHDAFERVGTKLSAVDVRYDATLDRAEAKLDGSTVVVRTPAGLYGNDIGHAIASAMGNTYVEVDGARLFAMDPGQVPAARHEAYYDAIVHYSQYDKAKTGATSWDPKRDVVGEDARGRSLQKVIAFHAVLPAGALRDKAAEHIAAEGEYYVLSAWNARTREVATAAPADSVLRRTQRAYVGYLARELAQLPAKVQSRTAGQLFPRGDDAAAEKAFAGFDRIGYALGLAALVYQRKAAPPTALEDEVVCPYHEGASGKLERGSSCNAGFYAAAATREDSRKRLARFLLQSDPRATQTAFANLRWAKGAPVFELFHDLEGNAAARTAAGKVLGDVFAREGEWREDVRKEGYALYARRADAHGIALYMILATDPYRGIESVSAGITPKIGAADVRDLLAVAPRSVGFVAAGWTALAFPKAGLVGPYLKPDVSTDTVLALARAACQEGKPSELSALRTSMENAARQSPTERSRFDGAIELIRPQACPPPSR